MIDEDFIRYAIAQKTAQKEIYNDDRRVQLEIEIKHLKGMIKTNLD